MNFSPRRRIAVLRGGASDSYDTSLKSGGHVLSILRENNENYEPLDVFISKDGEWHLDGLVIDPHTLLRKADLAWNALHGSYGEDGQVQKILESLQVPFTGSGSMSSAISMNKEMAKRFYQDNSLPTPSSELFTEDRLDEDKLIHVFRNYLHPVIVKPANKGQSLGVRLAHTFSDLKEAIKETFKHSPRVLVEEYVKGYDVTCTVIDEAKGEKIYALIPISDTKLNTEENKQIEAMAKLAHQVLGLRHYSSSDFIITPKRKIYILETNSLPPLHKDSHVHSSLKATGWHPRDFVEHILKLV